MHHNLTKYMAFLCAIVLVLTILSACGTQLGGAVTTEPENTEYPDEGSIGAGNVEQTDDDKLNSDNDYSNDTDLDGQTDLPEEADGNEEGGGNIEDTSGADGGGYTRNANGSYTWQVG